MNHLYPAYKKYKKSGLNSPLEIPESWKRSKLKYAVILKAGFAFKSEAYSEDGVPVIRIGDVLSNGFVDVNGAKKVSEKFLSEQPEAVIRYGDFLMAMTGGTIGKVAKYEHHETALLNQRVCCFRPLSNIDGGYLWYLLNSSSYLKYIDLMAFGGAQPNISDTQLKDFEYAEPPINEQIAIANFLDLETTKIDKLIGEQERLIRKTIDRRVSLICDCVIKGITKDRLLKEIDIPWISEIPQNWSYAPLFSLAVENTKSNKGLIESNLLSLSYGKIIEKDINSSDGLLPESFENYQIVDKNDIVFRLTDLQNDKKSLRTAIVENKGIITAAYLAVKPFNILPEYFNYLMRAYDLMKVFYSMGGGLRQSIKFSDLKRLPVLVPPAEEQREISDKLNSELQRQDLLLVKCLESIELMKQLKSNLISEALNGKIDLRNLVN